MTTKQRFFSPLLLLELIFLLLYVLVRVTFRFPVQLVISVSFLTVSSYWRNRLTNFQLANLEIRRIGSIRQYLSVEATKTLVSSLVLLRLDYCNALLAGCPQVLLDKMQRVIICSARRIYKASKPPHTTPLLFILHWLPISSRIQYKIALSCFHIISGTAPPYLSEFPKPLPIFPCVGCG